MEKNREDRHLNVNSIRARLERLLAFLQRAQPDVLCLQELKVVEDDFPMEAVEQAGYQAVVLGQRATMAWRSSPGPR